MCKVHWILISWMTNCIGLLPSIWWLLTSKISSEKQELFGNSQVYGRKFFLSRDGIFLAFDQSLFLVPLIGGRWYVCIYIYIANWVIICDQTHPITGTRKLTPLIWSKKSIAHEGCFQLPSFVLRSRSPEVAGTPQKLTFGSPWKMDSWNTIVSFWGKRPIFRCYVC